MCSHLYLYFCDFFPQFGQHRTPFYQETKQCAKKKEQNRKIPIHEDRIVNTRLKSQKPFLLRAQIITEAKEKTPDAWLAKWQRERPGGNQVDNVHTPVLSTDLSRKIWVRLNKICTRQCRYNKCIHR